MERRSENRDRNENRDSSEPSRFFAPAIEAPARMLQPKIGPMEVPSPEVRAKELLRTESAEVYKAQLEHIWWILIRTRESMHVLNSIVKFPLRKFVHPDEIGFFWNVLVMNCGNAVVLSLHSLLNDNEKDTLSLRKLANSVRDWIKPEYLDWYQSRLRDAKFDANLQDVAERVRKMRHDIAHIFVDDDGMPSKTGHRISESEIEELYGATRNLFKTASLTEEFVIDTHELTVGPSKPRPMDKMLELVAKNSNWINMPESRKEWWPMHRKHMKPEELEELNNWRARFNMPPA